MAAVWTTGYPFAYERELSTITVRSFSGHVISDTMMRELRLKPRVYELSFQCPRGLSGAALANGPPWTRAMVRGMVLGNKITSMTVFHEVETLKEHGREFELRREEALHLGVALKASVLLSLRFRSLGCSLADWLGRHGLLKKA